MPHQNFRKANFAAHYQEAMTKPLLNYAIVACTLVLLNSSTVVPGENHLKLKKGGHDGIENFGERIFTNEEMEHLKNTTTLFLLRMEDLDRKSEFEKAIRSGWDFTEIKVIGHEELGNYKGKSYSYFFLEGYNKSYNSEFMDQPGQTYNAPQLYLTLKSSMSKVNKEGKSFRKEINYCRIELFPDTKTAFIVTNLASKDLTPYCPVMLYTRGIIRNWTPGMMTVYLKDVQANLEKSKRAFLQVSIKEDDVIENLKNHTLYVPKYALTKCDKYTGDENKMHSTNSLFKRYTHDYEIVEAEELSRKIEAGQVDYVLDYVRSSGTKYVRIFSLSHGKIYQECKVPSYNLKPKDLGSILN